MPETKLPPVFIEGWISDQYKAGRRPSHREPLYPLPRLPPDTPPMEVVTGFLAARCEEQ